MAFAAAEVLMREVIHIDEELCNGCGECIPACKEGALKIVEGKARLVSDVYCDGMGACLGHCPQGAISIERRPAAAAYDEAAVQQHLQQQAAPAAAPASAPAAVSAAACGCPGAAARSLQLSADPSRLEQESLMEAPPSQLRNWPVELKLAPLEAPYFDGADLLLSADCVAFAHPAFHQRLLAGRTLLIGCPKLDDAQLYSAKLAEIFKRNAINSVTVAFMEVPCCFGLVALTRQALQQSGKQIEATLLRIGLDGTEQYRLNLEELPLAGGMH